MLELPHTDYLNVFETKFLETKTETLKNLAKVSRPRPKPRLLLKLNSENLGLTSRIGIFRTKIWEFNR